MVSHTQVTWSTILPVDKTPRASILCFNTVYDNVCALSKQMKTKVPVKQLFQTISEHRPVIPLGFVRIKREKWLHLP